MYDMKVEAKPCGGTKETNQRERNERAGGRGLCPTYGIHEMSLRNTVLCTMSML